MTDENYGNSKTNITSKDVLDLDQKAKEKEFNEESYKDNEQRENTITPSKWVLWPNRTIIIEPAFALFYTFHIASFPLTMQYTYFAIGERYNLSAYSEMAKGENGTGMVCGSSREENENNTFYQLQQQAQAENARFNMYMDLLTEIPGLFILMFMGTLMDKFGRKPALLIALVGAIVRNLAFITQMVLGLPLELIAIGYFISAMTGGISTFLTACYSYYADTIPQKRLGFRMTIADVVYGLLLAAMSSGVGYMIEAWGYLWPYVFIEGGHLLNLFYIIFFVPESVKRRGPRKSVSPKYILTSLKVLPKKRPYGGRTLLILFVTGWSIFELAVGSRPIQTLFQLNSPLCWSAIQRGNWSAIGAIISNLSQIVMSLVLFRYATVVGNLLLGMVSQMTYLLVFAFSTTSEIMYGAAIAGFALGACNPLMRTIMTGLVTNEERGALFASVSAIDRLLGIASSPLLNLLYAETLFFFTGTVFLLTALFAFIGIILVLVFLVYRKKMQALRAADERTVGQDMSVKEGQEMSVKEGQEMSVKEGQEMSVNEGQEDLVIYNIRL